MKRTMQFTIQVEVHPMSKEDIEDCGIELDGNESPKDFVADAEIDEIAMAIADYIVSEDNEALSDSGQYVTLKNPDLLTTEWVANLHSKEL